VAWNRAGDFSETTAIWLQPATMAASRRTAEFLKRSDFIMICLLLLLKNASRIKLGIWLGVLSLSRFEQPIVVAELRFRRSFNYEFKIYVCRQVLFIGCGWFLDLHKQSACSGEQAANWSAGCAKVAHIWQQDIPAALDRW
jgi:hypothetical protein